MFRVLSITSVCWALQPAVVVQVQNTAVAQPAARGCHAMVGAGAHGVVMFGGAASCGLTPIPDLNIWKWDGARWSVLTQVPDAIGAREDALLAYDEAGSSLILVGGRRGQQVFEDTWVWNGTNWRKAADAGQGPREHAAMAYDPIRRRVVLHGGGGRSRPAPFTDTCEWDGTVWRCQSTSSGPGPRIGGAMTWSPAHKAVVLYGGFAGSAMFRDAWSWDGTRWRQVGDAGPGTTEGHVIAGGPDGLWVLPTEDGVTHKRAWKLFDGKWARTGEAGPADLIGQAVAFDARRQRLIVFGGHGPNRPANNQTVWESDGRVWSSRPSGSS